jgi:DNA-binding response OmpR family regulator
MGSIAIVEDDLDASEQFRKALLRDGHTVTTFATRSKAGQGQLRCRAARSDDER